jgi:hypothetical protein
MLAKLLLCLGFIASVHAYSISESCKQSYAKKMEEGFFLQSVGKTRQAFFRFKEGYQEALKLGESPQKLAVINDLFVWYRTYGYSAGIMLHPANFGGEFRSHSLLNSQNRFGRDPGNFDSEWGKSPEQAKHIRQFMLGVGMFISGILAVSVNPPLFGPTGKTLCISGFTQMYLGLSNGYAEWEQRVREVQQIELKTRQFSDTK